MPADQQGSIPTYKETANIPKPSTAYYLHQQGSGPGAGLARLLKAGGKFAAKAQQESKTEPTPEENAQLAALADMGASRDRLRLSQGKTLFGGGDGDVTLDAYETNRGRRDADLMAGELRTAYAEAQLHINDDPKAYQQFVDEWKTKIFEGIGDSDKSYYHGFITSIGSVFKTMGLTHAGNLDGFIQGRTKTAAQSRIDQANDLSLSVSKEKGAFGNLMDSLMGAESSNNYNAFSGNTNNKDIRFTNMSLSEIVDWQKSKAWQTKGGVSSAVGKYQFIQKTLVETIRASGLDPATTKFTPAVQDRLAFTRLLSARNLSGFLKGEISAENYLDKYMSKEWAGLKRTDGRGWYDGDGLNKASLSPAKSIAALIAFREAYIQDPKIIKTDKDGNLVSLNTNGPTQVPSPEGGEPVEQAPDMTTLLQTSPETLGVSEVEARSMAGTALVKFLEANPKHAERDDLEDLMADWGLPKAERERVVSTRDTLRKRSADEAAYAEKTKLDSSVSQMDEAVRTGDISKITETAPEYASIARRLTGVINSPEEISGEMNTLYLDRISAEDADVKNRPGAANFTRQALYLLANQQIDRDTYTKAMALHETALKAKEAREAPGVEAFATSLLTSLPKGRYRTMFDQQMNVILADLTDGHGKRPPMLEVLKNLNELHQTLASRVEGERGTLLTGGVY